MSKFRWLKERVYADFLMPSRLDELRGLMQLAASQGYQAESLASFWEKIAKSEPFKPGKHLILRHDIDTDPRTARAMWKVEKSLGMTQSSFLFRLSTVDLPFMRELAEQGVDVGYHFEEVATIARKEGLRTKEQALAALPRIREEFARNLTKLRRASGLALTSTVAHGDFINQRLGLTNSVILDDLAFRQEMGIRFEGYDREFGAKVDVYHSDEAPPILWRPANPEVAINHGIPVISLLLHPRQWRVGFRANVRENSVRLAHEFLYRRACANRAGGDQ
jgi:hypothetical protein